MDDSYGHGKLLKFAVTNNWQALIQPHHEADYGLHLDLFAPVVIGHEFDQCQRYYTYQRSKSVIAAQCFPCIEHSTRVSMKYAHQEDENCTI